MDIQHGSLVDTVIEYASVKFGVELEVEQVSRHLRDMSITQTMELIDIIKREDDNEFSSIIDMSAVNESGGTIAPSAAAIRPTNTQMKKDAVATRRANNTAIDQNRDSAVVQRTVAGSNKTATGNNPKTPAPPAPDAQGQHRQSNSDAIANTSNQSAQNAAEIERLKQLAFGKR